MDFNVKLATVFVGVIEFEIAITIRQFFTESTAADATSL